MQLINNAFALPAVNWSWLAYFGDVSLFFYVKVTPSQMIIPKQISTIVDKITIPILRIGVFDSDLGSY
jgi:hypothetical protein